MDSKPNRSPENPPAPLKRCAAAAAVSGTSQPCGACKFLRRKCVGGCVFAPYFGTEQGSARFAAVHKVFGASNVSKLLQLVPAGRRHDAVVTVCYEAQSRLSNPIYGCVSTILALQQQVSSLQAELSLVQSQLINSRLAAATILQNSQPLHAATALQPAYSNNSSTSNNNNMVKISGFQPPELDVSDSGPASHSLDPWQLLSPLQNDEDEEEESRDVTVPFPNSN